MRRVFTAGVVVAVAACTPQGYATRAPLSIGADGDLDVPRPSSTALDPVVGSGPDDVWQKRLFRWTGESWARPPNEDNPNVSIIELGRAASAAPGVILRTAIVGDGIESVSADGTISDVTPEGYVSTTAAVLTGVGGTVFALARDEASVESLPVGVAVYRYRDGAWERLPDPPIPLTDLRAVTADEVWGLASYSDAVAPTASVARFDGSSWSTSTAPFSPLHFPALIAAGDARVVLVAGAGVRWEVDEYAIYGGAESFAVADTSDGVIARFDGAAWQLVTYPPPAARTATSKVRYADGGLAVRPDGTIRVVSIRHETDEENPADSLHEKHFVVLSTFDGAALQGEDVFATHYESCNLESGEQSFCEGGAAFVRSLADGTLTVEIGAANPRPPALYIGAP